MFLIKTSKKKNAQRFIKKLYVFKNFPKRFVFFKKLNVTQHNKYHKTQINQKKITPKINFKCAFYSFAFYLTNYISTTKNYYGVFKANNGFICILPLMSCLKIKAPIFFFKNIVKFFFAISIGSITSLKFLKKNYLVSNLGDCTPKYATSRGSYLITVKVTKKICFFKLPSGQFKFFKNNNCIIFGRNAAGRANKQIFGKASAFINDQNRIIVRSCKKNPIDHPNGGRTRGKMLFKTP